MCPLEGTHVPCVGALPVSIASKSLFLLMRKATRLTVIAEYQGSPWASMADISRIYHPPPSHGPATRRAAFIWLSNSRR